MPNKNVNLVSIVVNIPACHAGERVSIPRWGGFLKNFYLIFLKIYIFAPNRTIPGMECAQGSCNEENVFYIFCKKNSIGFVEFAVKTW